MRLELIILNVLNAGHSFRRSSATILANSGADMETIMRHGAWRNENCAKGYIEDALHYKQKTGNMITSSILRSSAGLSESAILPLIDESSSSATFGTSVHTSRDKHLSSAVDGISSLVNDTSSSSVIETNSSASSDDNVDDLFDNDIDNTELIEIVDRASQQVSDQQSVSSNGQKRRHESELFCSTQNYEKRSNSEASTVLTQHITTKSTKNAILPDAFKMFNFDNMQNCNFKFYVKE